MQTQRMDIKHILMTCRHISENVDNQCGQDQDKWHVSTRYKQSCTFKEKVKSNKLCLASGMKSDFSEMVLIWFCWVQQGGFAELQCDQYCTSSNRNSRMLCTPDSFPLYIDQGVLLTPPVVINLSIVLQMEMCFLHLLWAESCFTPYHGFSCQLM